MRTWLLVSIALIAGCGGNDGTPSEADATTDTRSDATADRPLESSSDAAEDVSETPPTSGTTGKECASTDDCDLVGDGVNACSKDWFAYGSLYPTPVCFGTSCTEAAPGKLAACDQGKGWCIGRGDNTRCYARCDFDPNSDAPPKGCVGKNACNWTGWVEDDKGVRHATGYCFGGCTADGDCPTGHVCQKEWGNCVRPSKHWVAKKKVGDPCTPADDGTSSKPPNCSCFRNNAVGYGYCSMFCRMGEVPSACPDGFTCDAELPPSGGDISFTKAAKGLAGACYKNCETDAECAPLGGFCDQNAGTGRKTCQFGVRPGSDAGADATSDGSDAG